VLTLSTKHDDSMLPVARKSNITIKPPMVLYYNKTKQEIDVSDQLASYHSCLRKTVRWYHKVVIEILLGTAVVNAMITLNAMQYNNIQLSSGKVMSVIHFRESLCRMLLQTEMATEIGDGSIAAYHYLKETEDRESGRRSDRRIRRYCIGCSDKIGEMSGRDVAKKKAKRVTTECNGCLGKPRFCFECFPKFHTCKLQHIPDTKL
jgi:hypothetical protein